MKAVLDHVGIAVRDLQSALAFYRDALGLEVEASEEVVSQRVRALQDLEMQGSVYAKAAASRKGTRQPNSPVYD